VAVENSGDCVQVTFTNQPLGCVDGYQTGPTGVAGRLDGYGH
jgi:hypothetical protein